MKPGKKRSNVEKDALTDNNESARDKYGMSDDGAQAGGDDMFMAGDDNIEYMSDEDLLGLDDNFGEEMDFGDDF